MPENDAALYIVTMLPWTSLLLTPADRYPQHNKTAPDIPVLTGGTLHRTG